MDDHGGGPVGVLATLVQMQVVEGLPGSAGVCAVHLEVPDVVADGVGAARAQREPLQRHPIAAVAHHHAGHMVDPFVAGVGPISRHGVFGGDQIGLAHIGVGMQVDAHPLVERLAFLFRHIIVTGAQVAGLVLGFEAGAKQRRTQMAGESTGFVLDFVLRTRFFSRLDLEVAEITHAPADHRLGRLAAIRPHGEIGFASPFVGQTVLFRLFSHVAAILGLAQLVVGGLVARHPTGIGAVQRPQHRGRAARSLDQAYE